MNSITKSRNTVQKMHILVKNGDTLQHDAQGRLMYSAKWVHGRKSGPECRYYENGNIQCETLWNNGQQDGMETWFREDGTKEMETLWEKGERSFVTDCFDENGMKSFGIITDGKNHDEHVRLFYDAKGDITNRILYKSGVRQHAIAMDAFLDNLDKMHEKKQAASHDMLALA